MPFSEGPSGATLERLIESRPPVSPGNSDRCRVRTSSKICCFCSCFSVQYGSIVQVGVVFCVASVSLGCSWGPPALQPSADPQPTDAQSSCRRIRQIAGYSTSHQVPHQRVPEGLSRGFPDIAGRVWGPRGLGCVRHRARWRLHNIWGVSSPHAASPLARKMEDPEGCSTGPSRATVGRRPAHSQWWRHRSAGGSS